MADKKVYSFHYATREYMGEDWAQESPLEPGVWLLPANATYLPPPIVPADHVAVFGTDSWLIIPVQQAE